MTVRTTMRLLMKFESGVYVSCRERSNTFFNQIIVVCRRRSNMSNVSAILILLSRNFFLFSTSRTSR